MKYCLNFWPGSHTHKLLEFSSNFRLGQSCFLSVLFNKKRVSFRCGCVQDWLIPRVLSCWLSKGNHWFFQVTSLLPPEETPLFRRSLFLSGRTKQRNKTQHIHQGEWSILLTCLPCLVSLKQPSLPLRNSNGWKMRPGIGKWPAFFRGYVSVYLSTRENLQLYEDNKTLLRLRNEETQCFMTSKMFPRWWFQPIFEQIFIPSNLMSFFFRWVGKNHQPVSHLLWVLPGPWLYPTGSLGICEHHYTSRRHAEYRTLAKKLGSSERCWVFFGMLQKTAKNCASLKMAIFVEWWMKNLEWWCFFFSVVYLTGRMDSDGFWLQ